jgi:hypothetical protein
MDYKGMDFPQYRKLTNEKAFYRINDARNFDEIQRIGARVNIYHFHAEQYPEILLIQDMLDLTESYLVSTKREFEQLLAEQDT